MGREDLLGFLEDIFLAREARRLLYNKSEGDESRRLKAEDIAAWVFGPEQSSLKSSLLEIIPVDSR